MSDSSSGDGERSRYWKIFERFRRSVRRIAYGLPLPISQHAEQANDLTSDAQGPLGAFGRYNRAYFQRWMVIGALIGVGAGLSMILFFSAIKLCTNLLLGTIAGYIPPAPSGEGATFVHTIARPWLIPVATTIGGLLTGLIVYTLAPETVAGGTDASIRAFHEKQGRIRARVPAVKLVASALTIGSGGSAGREGAAAQIMAGIGSWIGDVFHLDDHDRRIAVIAGIGSGIGTVFRAPFAGALFSTEVPYKRDFETDALFPTFIAAVVGYAIYGAWAGWAPVFGSRTHFTFENPLSLVGFLILGIIAGGLGLVFQRMMQQAHRAFLRIHIPLVLKPALGGLIVGCIGIFLPEALGMGYGWVQFGVNNDYLQLSGLLLGVLVLVKMLATSITLGSGGSGGDVAPAMVVGGFLGGSLWALLHLVAPGLVFGIQPGAFVIVGMGAFFGGISKTPLAMILMVVEMTGEYALIVPAMLATMVAYLVTGEASLYEEQVPTRLDSPAHKNDYALPLLQSLTVADAMVIGLSSALAVAAPDTTLPELSRLLRERPISSIPIIERNGQLAGVVTATDLARVAPQEAEGLRARQVMSRAVIRTTPDESLYAAWLRMSRRGLRQLVVVDRAEPTRPLGMLTADAIGRVLLPQRANGLATGGASRSTTSANDAKRAIMEGAEEAVSAVRRGADVAVATAQNHFTDERVAVGLDDVGDEDDEANLLDLDPRGSPTDVLTAQQQVRGQHTRDGVSSARNAPEAQRANDQRQISEMGDPLVGVRVVDAMLTTPRLVRDRASVSVARRMLEERGAALMVIDEQGRLVGIVTRSDLKSQSNQDAGRPLTIGNVMVRNLVTARPQETLQSAVHRMNRLGLRQLPVVGAETPSPPLGLLRRSDVLAAYERAMGEHEQITPAAEQGEMSAGAQQTLAPHAEQKI